jgi:hypothetical protein
MNKNHKSFSTKMEDQIGERMKVYEKNMKDRVDPSLPWCIRLDGHKFSSFTKGFRKPYDVRSKNSFFFELNFPFFFALTYVFILFILLLLF